MVIKRILKEVEFHPRSSKDSLRWFLSFALRIPTAHNMRVISERKHDDLYFSVHKNIVHIILFNLKQK